jgi:hypothetical protein
MPLPKEPAIKIRELLVDDWNDASTAYGEMPRVVTGWVENDDWDKPHICLLMPDESPDSGGNTGFRGMQVNGKPMKRMIGSIVVACLSHEDVPDMNTDAETLVYQMSEEVKRIINQHYLSPGDGINWISFIGRRSVMDTVRRPIIFRQDCDIRYSYDDRI